LERAKAAFLQQAAQGAAAPGGEEDAEGECVPGALSGAERVAARMRRLLAEATAGDALASYLPAQQEQDDDTSWMQVTDAQLSQLLEAYRARTLGEELTDEAGVAADLHTLSRTMATFVERSSGPEGVDPSRTGEAANGETASGAVPPRKDLDSSKEEEEEEGEEEEGLLAHGDDVELDADAFLATLAAVLGLSERDAASVPPRDDGSAAADAEDLEAIWEQMAGELKDTTLAQSFARAPPVRWRGKRAK
jgi:hypothetical protein